MERSVVVAEVRLLADLGLEGVFVVDWAFRGVLAWEGGAEGRVSSFCRLSVVVDEE